MPSLSLCVSALLRPDPPECDLTRQLLSSFSFIICSIAFIASSMPKNTLVLPGSKTALVCHAFLHYLCLSSTNLYNRALPHHRLRILSPWDLAYCHATFFLSLLSSCNFQYNLYVILTTDFLFIFPVSIIGRRFLFIYP